MSDVPENGVFLTHAEVAVLRTALQNSHPTEDLIGALCKSVPASMCPEGTLASLVCKLEDEPEPSPSPQPKSRDPYSCPRCGSTDYLDTSQSFDCNKCGKSW
jgi:hypothetical protein